MLKLSRYIRKIPPSNQMYPGPPKPKQYPIISFDKSKLTTNARDIGKFSALQKQSLLHERPVFNLDELTLKLKEFGAEELAVIRIDPDKGYVDYMIVAMGLTRRHLSTIGLNMVKEYKDYMDVDRHEYPQLEGFRKNSDWVCINLQNCAIHLITEYSREKLMLEELHTLGEFDPCTTDKMPDEADIQSEAAQHFFQTEESQKSPEDIVDSLADQFIDKNADHKKDNYDESIPINVVKSLTQENVQEDMLKFEDFLKNQELQARKFLDSDGDDFMT